MDTAAEFQKQHTVQVDLSWSEVKALIGLYGEELAKWSGPKVGPAEFRFPVSAEDCVSRLVLLMVARDELQQKQLERPIDE